MQGVWELCELFSFSINLEFFSIKGLFLKPCQIVRFEYVQSYCIAGVLFVGRFINNRPNFRDGRKAIQTFFYFLNPFWWVTVFWEISHFIPIAFSYPFNVYRLYSYNLFFFPTSVYLCLISFCLEKFFRISTYVIFSKSQLLALIFLLDIFLSILLISALYFLLFGFILWFLF